MAKLSTRLSVAMHMPPLYHTLPGCPFAPEKSQVVEWLIAQPEIRQYLFDKVQKDFIVYNPVTKKWQGVEYR